MRAIAIDTLRGLCLVMMTFDHLLITPFDDWKKLYNHAYGPFGFFSAAEIFFFLSGLLIGFIIAKNPEVSLFYRVKKLYLANFLSLLCLAFLLHSFPTLFQHWNQEGWLEPFVKAPTETIIAAGLFLYLPYFFDVLPLYCLFFFLIPIIRIFLMKGQLVFLFILSGIMWMVGQFAPAERIENYLGQSIASKLPWFDPFAWQLLFVSAVVLGYLYKKNSHNKLFQPSKKMVFLTGIFCCVCFTIRHYYAGEEFFLTDFIDVKTLGFVRVLNFFAVVFFTCSLINILPKFSINIFSRLGSMSLVVFMYHAFLVYFLSLFHGQISGFNTSQKIILMVLSLCSLWFPVLIALYYKYFKNKIINNLVKKQEISTLGN